MAYDLALAARAHDMDIAGRTMRGFVVVPAALLADDDALDAWVERSVRFALELPPKKQRAPRAAPTS